MRIAGGVAAGAVVAGLIVAGGAAAPTARAAAGTAAVPEKAAAPAGVRARWAELANAYGPGLSAFIAKMNAAARTLGMTRTHFTDFSGLPYPGPYTNYSTAHDLIVLGRAAMRNRTFATIVAARDYRLSGGSAHWSHDWANLDPLLGKVPGAIGIKTGYTPAAGQCLLFEVKRGSTTLIGVVLDSSGVNSSSLAAAASDAEAMLDWGFRG